MPTPIKKPDLQPTLKDLTTLCTYIEKSNPHLTKTGALSLKACYEINSLLKNPKPNAKKTDKMTTYPVIRLLFQITNTLGFLEKYPEKGGKTALALSEKYETFTKANTYTQYLTVFLAWLIYTEPREFYYDSITSILALGKNFIDELFAEIEKRPELEWIEAEKPWLPADEKTNPLKKNMVLNHQLLQDLRLFGIIEFSNEDCELKDVHLHIVKRLQITPLGKSIAKACASRKFSWVNVFEDDLDFEEELSSAVLDINKADYMNNPLGTEGFFAPFTAIFPKGKLDLDLINDFLLPKQEEDFDNLVYEFKVSLSGKCYRVIQISSNRDFEDLHMAIQDAFEFNDDHLYSFFMDGRFWSDASINSPHLEEPPYSSDILLSDADLYINQEFVYLFDYGDEWRFKIKITNIFESEESFEDIILVKSVGKAPSQY